MKDQIAIAILGAGLGTRLKSKLAKVLHSVAGRTLIEHAVRTAREVSEGNLIVIVGHQAEAVIDALKDLPQQGLRFVRQEQQLGTGHALQCARRQLQTAGPHLLVFHGDTPLITSETLRRFIASHLGSGAAASVMTAEMEDPTGYGRILRAPDGSVASIVEQKSATPDQRRIREINTGIYCFETRQLLAELERIPRDPTSGEYYLTDVIGLLTHGGKKVQPYRMADASEVIGINNRAELAEVDALLRGRKARALMLAGVTILRPETVMIDLGVEVGPDTVLEPGVTLAGETRVGENCRIGSFSVITDSALEDNVTVKQSCVIGDSKIANGASIGPFAHLRPGSDIGPGAKIGNFVEVKKTRVGRGTKASHLTYLGDAVIGDNVNVGAGTIIVNYDGEKKHTTVIEDNAFVGSGARLIAPVRVGENAFIAAGSTITEEVPPDSLSIARARQTNKPGWVTARKRKAGKKSPEEKNKTPGKVLEPALGDRKKKPAKKQEAAKQIE